MRHPSCFLGTGSFVTTKTVTISSHYKPSKTAARQVNVFLKRRQTKQIQLLPTRTVMTTAPSPVRIIESDFSVFHIFSSADELVKSFGEYVSEVAKKSVDAHGSFSVAISGGSVLEYFNKAVLETVAIKDKIEWDKTRMFLVDERYVPWENPQSNYGQLRTMLDSAGVLNKLKTIPVDTKLPLEECAAKYEADILAFDNEPDFIIDLLQPVPYKANRVPAFDLVLLGLGEDGHTASLFPNHESLQETSKLVTYERNAPKPPPERITLTFPSLNYGRNVAFVVAGQGKAEILRSLCEDHHIQYPARMVTPFTTRKQWFVDQVAVSKVSDAENL